MVKREVLDAIVAWTDWANLPENNRYDIALLKIWIQFEKYMAYSFVNYATGNSSEDGYSPTLKLQFADEAHLNPFLRSENRTYVDYPTQIKKLSKHIFESNPFDVIYSNADIWNAYDQMGALRNYIAHESGEAKQKLIEKLFGGDSAKFKEPNDFLKTKKKNTGKTYYSYYTETIKNAVILLSDPPRPTEE